MPILTVVKYQVRPEAAAAWEQGVARIAERAREQEDPVRWGTSQVTAGPFGVYYVGLASETVAEAAAREQLPQLLERLFGAKEAAALGERLAGCVASAETSVLRDRPDLGYPADPGRRPQGFVLTRMTVRGGHQDAAEELIRKVAEAVPKTGESRHFTVYQPLLGDLRQIAAVRPIFELSELDDAAPVPELLDRAFGAAEGGLIFRSGSEAIESLEAELAIVREDLSYPPEA